MSAKPIPSLEEMQKLMESVPQVKTSFDMELTGVRLSWGAGITNTGESLFVLRIQNHDETWGVRIPMQAPYLEQKLRELEDVKKQLAKTKADLEAGGGTNPGK